MLDEIAITTLPNGVRVITSRLPWVKSVSLGIWTSVGGRHETVAESGLSHFLEHMVFKGTRRRNARQISQAVESRGGSLNAYTDLEKTVYYVRVPSRSLALGLDVLADMTTAPRLDPADIVKERHVVLEEIAMGRDQADSHVFDMVYEALWRGHPLGRPLIGTEKSLVGVTRESMETFRQNHYTAGGTIFAAAGLLEHEAFVAQVSAYADRLARLPEPGYRAVRDSTPQRELISEWREIEQVQFVAGFRTFGRRDPRRHALRILNTILGEGMSSRLFQLVRERHGLAYALSSSVYPYADTGALLIDAAFAPDKTGKAVDLIARELARLAQQGVGEREFKRARESIIGSLDMVFEAPMGHLNWIAGGLQSEGRVVQPAEIQANLMTVSPDDIRDLAAEIFRLKRLSVAAIVPHGYGDVPQRCYRAFETALA